VVELPVYIHGDNDFVNEETGEVVGENVPGWMKDIPLKSDPLFDEAKVVEMKDYDEIDPTDPPDEVMVCERDQRKHKQTRVKRGDNMYVECKTCNHKFNFYMP
jgi:hypothetical protein